MNLVPPHPDTTYSSARWGPALSRHAGIGRQSCAPVVRRRRRNGPAQRRRGSVPSSQPPAQDRDDTGVGPQPVAGAQDRMQLGGAGGGLGQGAGIGQRHVGVVGPSTTGRGRPFNGAASSAGCSTDISLAQASTEAGNPGVCPRRSGGSAPAGAAGRRQRGPGGRGCPGRPRRPPARPPPRGAAPAHHEPEAHHQAGGGVGDLPRRPGRPGRPASPGPRSGPPTRRRPRNDAVATSQADSRVRRSARAG